MLRVRHIVAGALLLGGVAGAQSIDEERRALEQAKTQSEAANARADGLERHAFDGIKNKIIGEIQPAFIP